MSTPTKRHRPDWNTLEPHLVPISDAMTNVDDAGKSGRSIEMCPKRRRLSSIVRGKKVKVTMCEVEKSKFVKEMHGKEGRCGPCYIGKSGPCLRDPDRPNLACLHCIEKNREEECKFHDPQALDGADGRSQPPPQKFHHPASALEVQRDTTNRNMGSVQTRLPLSNQPYIPSIKIIGERSTNYEDLSNWHQDLAPSLLSRSPKPIPASPLEKINNKLSQYFNRDLVRHITDFLRQTIFLNTVPIKYLRTAVVRTPKNDKLWPIVLWDEGDDTEMILITKVEPGEGVYSSILHRSIDTGVKEASRWKSEISWYLGIADDLGELVGVAAHVFDLLTKLDPNMTKHLFDKKTTEVPEQELFSYAMTLFPVHYRVREFEKRFENGGKYWVESLSERIPVQDNDGNRHSVLHHIVEV